MTDNQIDPKQAHFFIRARLECGAEIVIAQRQPGVAWELIITPKLGTQIEDFARSVNGKLNINLEEGSALGVYQLFSMIINPPKRRKFLGIF